LEVRQKIDEYQLQLEQMDQTLVSYEHENASVDGEVVALLKAEEAKLAHVTKLEQSL